MLSEAVRERLFEEALLPELKLHGNGHRQTKRTARRVGLARLLRLLTAVSIPPLWAEIALLHYRGSFQSRFMWIPVLGLPVILAGHIASLLELNERRSRAVLRPFAALMAAMGVI